MKDEFSEKMSRSLGIGYFVNPWPLSAVALLILNDHYLKHAHPSFLTGKLSDFAGLFFFPLLLCAVWNLAANGVAAFGSRRFHWISGRQVLIAVILTDLIFIGVKIVPEITQIYLDLVSRIGYPSRVARDPTDLVALSMNLLTVIYARAQRPQISA